MPTFKNVSSLIKYLNATVVPQVLQNDVADHVGEEIKSNYETMVYGAYSPVVYERTGALTDDANIEKKMIGQNTVSIENVASPSEALIKGYSVTANTLPLMIEEGYIGNPWNDKDYPWTKPRKVIQTTRDQLESSKSHIQAFREGLRKRGIDVV